MENFNALGKDYARSTGGRTLMVSELRTGSILATLADAAAVIGPAIKDVATIAEAAGAMEKFGRKLFGAISRAKAGGGGVFEGGRKRDGQASTEAILKIAADSHAEVDIKQTAPDGFKTEIKFRPAEAVRIREEAAGQRLKLKGRETHRLLETGRSERLTTDSLLGSLLSLSGPAGQVSSDAQEAIAAIVTALREGGFEMALTSLALALERGGRSDLASLVRTL